MDSPVTGIETNSNQAPVMIGSRPALINLAPMRFLIMDAPRESNLHLYIKEMKKHSVTDIVRVCEPTYTVSALESAGIKSHDLEYQDGHAPSMELIDRWLSLVENTFYKEGASSQKCIAVHCVAGLGRAPSLVAIACIEFANMDPVEAVAMIRKYRRGAINEKQLIYLEGYRRHFKRGGNGPEGGCCVIL